MFFEVIDSNGKTVFNTTENICLPKEKQIKLMLNLGYKFKVDNRFLSKKTLNEFIKRERL